MYNNSYNRPKVALEKKVIRKSKEKSCGYYLRIIFFFSSLIQSLIIVSLVLLLVYGQSEKTPEEMRLEDLEESVNKLWKNNTELRKNNAMLSSSLKTKTTEKDLADKKLIKLTAELDAAKANNTKNMNALLLCSASKASAPRMAPPVPCPSSTSSAHFKSIQTSLDHQKALYIFLQNNFTQTVYNLKLELERAAKEKTKHEMSVMQLQQEKEDLTSELQLYRKTCKEDFVSSLQGIQAVTTAFLAKIDNLFPDSFTFLLTCSKQQEQMERIQANCTSLSRQVESKFQSYLNVVGDKVSNLHAKSSHLEVQNRRLTSDLQQCSQSRTQETERCKKLVAEAQETQDKLVEPLLLTQKQLMQEKQLLQTMCAPRPIQPPVPKPSGLDASILFGQGRAGGISSGTSAAGQSLPGGSQTPKVR